MSKQLDLTYLLDMPPVTTTKTEQAKEITH